MDEEAFREELRHSIKVGIATAKVQKKWLFNGIMGKDQAKSDRCLDELSKNIEGCILRYKVTQIPPATGHSIQPLKGLDLKTHPSATAQKP